MKIGILAVQGDFEAHAAMLGRLGVETAEIRTPAQLEGCDGLILPGGESTTQLQFLREEGLADAVEKFAKQGGAIFGTCAGAILLATEVQNPKQDSLKLLDMTVLRNAYGRQIASDKTDDQRVVGREREVNEDDRKQRLQHSRSNSNRARGWARC